MLGTLLFVSAFYCCVTTYHKVSGLNKYICYLTFSGDLEYRKSLAGSSAHALIRLKSAILFDSWCAFLSSLVGGIFLCGCMTEVPLLVFS